MSIKLYKDQKKSLYQIEKELGLAGRTLYLYANGTRNIDNMKIGMLVDIAQAEGIPYPELYEKIKERK